MHPDTPLAQYQAGLITHEEYQAIKLEAAHQHQAKAQAKPEAASIREEDEYITGQALALLDALSNSDAFSLLQAARFYWFACGMLAGAGLAGAAMLLAGII